MFRKAAAFLLLAAVALPSLATAQVMGDLDRDAGPRRERPDGERPDRGERQAPPQQAPQPQQAFAPPQAPQVQPRQDDRRQDQPRTDGIQARDQGRSFAGYQQNGPGARQDRGDRPAQTFDGRTDRGGQVRLDQYRADQYRADGRGQADRGRDGRDDRQNDGRGFGNDRRDDRRDGRDDRDGFRNDRGGFRNDGPAWRDGGAWTNGWRQDRRFDWRGYRDGNRGLFRLPRYYAPRGYGYGYRRWSIGIRIDPWFYDQGYWIDDPYEYRLPPAYGPYRWVRYYNDVLLVDIGSGYVRDVIYSFFY